MPRDLFSSVAAFNDVKHEHMNASQSTPAGRAMTLEDVATIETLLTGTGIDAAEAVAVGEWVVWSMVRDLNRAGLLLGAKRSVLRSTIFAAWFDGLAVGARHYRANVQERADA